MSSATLTKTAPAAPVPNSRRGRRRSAMLRRFLPLLPAVALLLLFFAGPVLWSCYAAFTDQALSGAGAQHPQFIGLANFRRMLDDPIFIQSILLTVIFVVGSAVIGQNTLGLIIALLLRRRSRPVQATVSIVVVGAWVMPEIVAAFCWYAFLNRSGSLNHWLNSVGLTQNWLYTAPMFAVILANVWRGTAFSMMVYSAALSDIPPEIEEAASIDGAGGRRRVWDGALPVIPRPVMTNPMLVTLQTPPRFTPIWGLTGGGPRTQSPK